MGVFFFLQAAFVGAFVSVGIISAAMWFLSRREWMLIVFSIHCVLCALASLWVIRIASAEDTAAMNMAMFPRTITGLLVLVTSVTLVSRLTGTRARLYVNFVMGFAVTCVAYQVLVYPVIGPAVGVRHVHLISGETISAPILPPAYWLSRLIYAVMYSGPLFGMYASWRFWRKDPVGGWLVGLASVGMVVSYSMAIAVDVLRLDGFYLGALPLAPFVVLVALLFGREYASRSAALVASENRFRGIFDQTFQFTELLTADGILIEANKSALEFIGVDGAEVIGKQFWETPWWSHSPPLQQQLRTAMCEAASGKTVRLEVTHRRRDGNLAVVDLSLKPVRDQKGQIAFLISEGRDLTERLQAAAILRESEEFNSQVLASVQSGLVVLNPDLCYRMWNPAMERMTGISAAQVLGRSPQELFPFKERAGVIDAMRRALAGETVQTTDFPYEVTSTGRNGWQSELSGPLHNADGETIGVISSVLDVTVRHNAQEENRKLVHILGERVKELTCLHRTSKILQDNKLSTADWLKEIPSILHSGWQYSEDTAARVTFGELDFASPGFRETPWMQRAEFSAGEGNVKGTIEVVYLKEHPSEVDGPFLVEERNLIDSLAEMLSSAIDRRVALLALQANQEDLRREKEFIKTLMDCLPGIVFLNDGIRILKWNKVLEDVTGYSHEEIAGLTPLCFFQADDQAAIAQAIQRVLSMGHDELESSFLTKDGKTIPYYFKGVRLETEYGLCVLGVGLDISERRRLEDQFRQAQKMEAFGHLAGGIAHDFNNLLTIISGYSEIVLEMVPPDHSIHEPLKAIQDAGKRAASLTQQLLAFSRRTILQPSVLDLNSIVKETEKLLRRVIGEDINLVTGFAPSIGKIKADPGQLGQVLMNLAVNARDAMPQGGNLTIECCNAEIDRDYCELHPNAKPGQFVMLAVSDSGCGMTPEVQSRIFEPFFTTKGVGKGTGLGLSMVYGIVEQSGGHLEVHSEVGRGTSFKLYFPMVDEPVTAGTDGPTSESIRRGTGTVLLVEDEDGVRGLAQLALQSYGYRVLAAVDGAHALRILEDHEGPIDILVTDVVMPGMSGCDLSKALDLRFPGIRVLYVSGYTDDAVFRHGLLHSDVQFLNKPYTPLALVKKVQEVLTQK